MLVVEATLGRRTAGVSGYIDPFVGAARSVGYVNPLVSAAWSICYVNPAIGAT